MDRRTGPDPGRVRIGHQEGGLIAKPNHLRIKVIAMQALDAAGLTQRSDNTARLQHQADNPHQRADTTRLTHADARTGTFQIGLNIGKTYQFFSRHQKY